MESKVPRGYLPISLISPYVFPGLIVSHKSIMALGFAEECSDIFLQVLNPWVKAPDFILEHPKGVIDRYVGKRWTSI